MPIDLVQAYVWFELASRGYQEASNSGFDPKKLKEEAEQSHEYVGSLLNWFQKRWTQKLVRDWKPKTRADQ